MKKKLLLASAALLMAAVAATGFAAYEKSSMSDLMNANVEALARDELHPCPNGCYDCGNGCFCYQYYPTYKEAGSE